MEKLEQPQMPISGGNPNKEKEASRKEWEIERMRASGPGGQHMQKTESRVRVRWNFVVSLEFTEEEKERLRQSFPKGYIEATSQRSRFQQKNLALAREEARERAAAALAPVPDRVPTQVPRDEKARRLEEKKRVAERKKFRKPVRDW